MSQNGLLLAWSPQKRSERPHDGKIITLRTNLHWPSDGFEIPYWNRAGVRMTFVIDTCDHEIIVWGSTNGGFDGETVRHLMLLCVEHRFGAHRTLHVVEWATNNSSCYIAKETIAFGQSLGLVPCFTPVRSPYSNGMAESFVKTFKRDYVYVHDCPNASTVLTQLDR